LSGLTAAGGLEIVSINLGPIAAYWSQFGADSSYEVYFDYNEEGLQPLLATKNRERLVGAISRRNGGGTFVLLPPVRWDEGAFSYKRGTSEFWNKQGTAFGKRLVAAFIDTARTLQRVGARSSVPEWAAGTDYSTELENQFQRRMQQIDEQASALAEARRLLQEELEEAQVLRWLLFETGKPLERAILKALTTLGFSAGAFKEGESEFDAVFTAPEGRCLGEAEGKNNKAINVDKISQLGRNLEEDFAREEVSAYAKGVLFGNAFRLQPLAIRSEYFTEKCKTTAKRMKVALIRTPDLFSAARYLASTPDECYARTCRAAIFSAEGEIVAFPDPPQTSKAAASSGSELAIVEQQQ
jgi:hypothetical protein